MLYCADGNTEIAPSKFVVVNMKDYQVQHELDSNQIFASGEITTLNDAFYVNQGTKLMVYDYELNVVQEIDLHEYPIELGVSNALSEYREYTFSISPDRENAAYVNKEKNALVMYEFDTKKEMLVYQIPDEENTVCQFSSLYLVDEYIGFAGVYSDGKEVIESNVYGRIHIPTGQIDQYIQNGIITKKWESSMLVVDTLSKELDAFWTGEAMLYDIENNQEMIIDLEDLYGTMPLE